MKTTPTELATKSLERWGADTDASGENGRDIDNAARILFENPEFGNKVITHRFPLDAAEEAFKVADDRKSGSIKVVFDINV